MANKIILMGNLGQDPEIKQVGSGNSICKLTIATTEQYKSKSGEDVKKTQWHNVVVWGKQGEVIAKYFKKGSKIYVEGKVEYRSWETDDGTKKYATDIILSNFEFVDSKKTSGNDSQTDFGFESDDKIDF